jgi:hypothetical protein
MADKGYTVRDRRGGQNPEPAEVCRVCGSPEVHSLKYNQPTMECIAFYRSQVSGLDEKCQEWARAMQPVTQAKPTNQALPCRFRWPADDKVPTTEWGHGVYFPVTDLCVTAMGVRSTGIPTIDGLEWVDPLP